MNPFEPLEHPPQGRALTRLVDLVWHGLVLACQLLPQSTLRHRIHEQCQGHLPLIQVVSGPIHRVDQLWEV